MGMIDLDVGWILQYRELVITFGSYIFKGGSSERFSRGLTTFEEGPN